MALTKAQVREILSAAGVDAEHMSDAVNKIIDGHVASVEALRDEVSNLKETVKHGQEDAEKLESVQKELDGLKKQVEKDAKAREGKDYDKLKEEYDNFKAEVEKKAARAVKETAFREILKDADLDEKYFDKIIKYSDIDGIELDEKGKIKDAKDRIKSVVEEWPEYKISSQEKGAEVATPPANTGGKMTKEQIESIKDASERQQAMAENHELFGF